jgi:hypothetical protein
MNHSTRGDLTVADELFDPHYTQHSCASDCGTGPEGVKLHRRDQR